MWWHTNRNQISSFGERDESIQIDRGTSVQSTTGSRGVCISGSNAGYTMFRGSVKSTGYTLHSPVSPSLPPRVRHRVPLRFNWSLPPNNVGQCFVQWPEIVVTDVGQQQRKRLSHKPPVRRVTYNGVFTHIKLLRMRDLRKVLQHSFVK